MRLSPDQITRCPVTQPPAKRKQEQRPILTRQMLPGQQNAVAGMVKILEVFSRILLSHVRILVPDHSRSNVDSFEARLQGPQRPVSIFKAVKERLIQQAYAPHHFSPDHEGASGDE